ncbi:acyl carrier protein [Paenibacillus sp. BJ-4]|uniref:acyl carrier protein n=1 Tax=Paenibacillus sp. BJ-4 TaxID=2878097 RepID=UPI001CEFE8B0|nr:acyl carrier protein [Paenibacillus sp. BJ-4]
MTEAIFDLIKRKAGNSSGVNGDSSLMEIGIDSVEFITMIIELEEEFNIRFEDMQLIYDSYSTVGQLVSVVQQVIEKQKNM